MKNKQSENRQGQMLQAGLVNEVPYLKKAQSTNVSNSQPHRRIVSFTNGSHQTSQGAL